MIAPNQNTQPRKCGVHSAQSAAANARLPLSTSGGGMLFGILFLLISPQLAAQIPSTSQLKAESIAPQAQTIRTMDQVLQRRGSVTFRDTPLAEVILTLGQQWNVNIVSGADVSGTVSGTFREAPLREILDSLLNVNGYGYRQNGGSLLVLKQEEIGPNNPNFRVETLNLPPYLSGRALEEVLGALKVFSTTSGQLHAVPSNNTIVAHDMPERIEQMRAMLKNLTASPASNHPLGNGQNPQGMSPVGLASLPEFEIITLRPQFVSASELAKGVEMVIGSQGSFVTIEGEEALMVSGNPETIRRASHVMAQLDRARPQVRITAYIYDVSIGESEQSGIDWSSRFMSQSLDANGIPRDVMRNDSGLLTRNVTASQIPNAVPLGSTTTTAAAAAGATGPQWVFRTLSSNFELNTVIQALDETKGAKLLADPHVTVLDRHKATIDIITKVPIQQLTQTQQGGSIGTTAFEEAGVKLAVTPRISNDNTIQMVVTPEVSVLTGFSNGNPIIDARRSTTTVRVGNQQTLVIGGLRQKTAVETVRGIPGLMKMKYIGKLFRVHNTEMKESELIVFLQPEIIYCNTTGLPREEIALEQQKSVLSKIQVSCPGPHTPDCYDKNCPHHYPRARANRGMIDDGFVNPVGHDVSNFQIVSPQELSTNPPVAADHEGMQQRNLIQPSEVLGRSPR